MKQDTAETVFDNIQHQAQLDVMELLIMLLMKNVMMGIQHLVMGVMLLV